MFLRWARMALKAPMTSPTRVGRSSSGFTLIEVLVAALVVFAALAALLQVFVTALTGLDEAAASTRASWLLAEKLAEVEAQTQEGVSLPQSSYGQSSEAGTVFHWEMTVSPTSLTSGAVVPGADTIKLRAWRSSSDRTYSVCTCVRRKAQA